MISDPVFKPIKPEDISDIVANMELETEGVVGILFEIMEHYEILSIGEKTTPSGTDYTEE